MNDTRRNLLICALLATLVALVFRQVLSFDFINFDDPIYITENRHVQQGLAPETVKWAFTTHLHGHYHPLTWLSHAADVQFFGLDPAGHHFSGVLLHLLTSLLLFLALARMTGAAWTSGFVAALFAVHPLHVEPVAWVADRKDLLCGFFWTLSLWLYAGYVAKKSLWRLFLLMAAYLLGLLAKTMMITLPLVLLLMDIWPLQRFGRSAAPTRGPDVPVAKAARLLLEKSGLLLIAGIFVLVSTGAMEDLRVEAKTLSPFWRYDFLLFLPHYLQKFIWPVRLSPLYPYVENPAVLQLFLGAAGLAAVTLITVLVSRRFPFLLTGWLWFLVTLLPVAGLIHGGPHRVADRYTYIPLIGLFIALAWTWKMFSDRNPHRPRTMATAAVVLLTVLSVLSWQQANRWRSSISLFEHVISVHPANEVALNNLGDALDRQGKKQEAMDRYLAALAIRPDYARARYNLGNTLASLGRTEEALYHYQATLVIFPEFAQAHNNAGVLLARKKRYLEAKEHFAAALAQEPDYADARNNLADLQTLLRDLAEKIAAARKQLAADPDNGDLHNDLGLLHRESGDPAMAEYHFQEALRRNPGFAGAHNNLAILYAERGDLSRAAEHFQRAVDLDPTLSGARINLERAREALKQNHQ
ncbi:MAG: tetratricopeptide repeat protein [Thermodesulfobacteriota bacterium]